MTGFLRSFQVANHRLFRDEATYPAAAQLLLAARDTTLLGTHRGAEFLRRDELWFLEKNGGVSVLYPLSDFHPRGENRGRRGPAGSYGLVSATGEQP